MKPIFYLNLSFLIVLMRANSFLFKNRINLFWIGIKVLYLQSQFSGCSPSTSLGVNYTTKLHFSGCSVARSSRLLWEQEVAGSNPATPTFKVSNDIKIQLILWRSTNFIFFETKRLALISIGRLPIRLPKKLPNFSLHW